MSTTLEQTAKDLVEATKAADQKARREHWATLLELLRSGGRTAADAKAALRHLEGVGLTVDSLPRLASAVAEHSRLSGVAVDADDPALATEIEAASNAVHGFDAETERIAREREAERGRLWNAFSQLNAKRSSGAEAKRKLAVLEKTHRELFGLDLEPETEAARQVPGMGPIIPHLPIQLKAPDQQARVTMGVDGYQVYPVAK